jgi:FMN hydrolase / 5-amino-6-(5-phospho-D-ribitylamino)uracil phosphatase
MILYRKIDKIQAISFDLDDTLYDNQPFIVEAEIQLRRFLHDFFPLTKNCDKDFWFKIKTQVLKQQPELKLDMGQLRRHTLYAGLSHVGYQDEQLVDGVEQCFQHFYFHRSNFKVEKTICSLLNELSLRVPLVAITNGNVNLEQIGISEYFQHSLHANLEQPMKPHPKMFGLACDYLNLPPRQILHVGDSLINDVYGAHRAGMRTAWYAHNRNMHLSKESTVLLPDIALHNLDELMLLF